MLYPPGEIFKRFGGEGSRLIEQPAERVVEWRGGGSLAKKGISENHLLQVVSVSTQAGSHRGGYLGSNSNCRVIRRPGETSGRERVVYVHPWLGTGA